MVRAATPSVAPLGGPAQPPRFDVTLTLDEFRVIAACIPTGGLHRALNIGSIVDSSRGEQPAAERETTARAALESRALLTADSAGTLAVHPLLMLSLLSVAPADHTISIQSWTPGFSSQTTVSVVGNLASVVTFTLPRRGNSKPPSIHTAQSGTAQISLGAPSIIVAAVDKLLVLSAPEPSPVTPLRVTIGLVESRSLIEALRRGDSVAVGRITTLFRAQSAVPLLLTLAASFESGMRIRAFDRGAPRFSSTWAQSSKGEWIGFRLLGPARRPEDAGAAAKSAPKQIKSQGQIDRQSLVESGRIELTRQHRTMIAADLVSLVISYTISENKGTTHAA